MAQQKRAIAQGGLDQVGDGFGLDLKDFATREGGGTHAFPGEQAVFGSIGAQRKRFLIEKGRCRHGGRC